MKDCYLHCSPDIVLNTIFPAMIPSVCLIKLDQRSGVIFWVSCDQATIGITVAFGGYPQELYHTKGGGIKDVYVDWLRGTVYWLEGVRLLSMGVQGGPAKELLNLSSGFTGTIALDLRANAMLWTTASAGGWSHFQIPRDEASCLFGYEKQIIELWFVC